MDQGEYQHGGNVGAAQAKHARFQKSHGFIVLRSFLV
jgi:hypothetical protein